MLQVLSNPFGKKESTTLWGIILATTLVKHLVADQVGRIMACIMACVMACCTIHDVVYLFQNDQKICCRRIKFWSVHFCIARQYGRRGALEYSEN